MTLLQRSHWQLSLLSGILVGLSYPPLPGFLVWIGFVPLIHVWMTTTPRESMKWSYMASITANFLSLYWMGLNQGAGWLPVFASLIASVLYLGLFWAGLGYIVSWIHQRTGRGFQVLPFLWVTMEYVRGIGPLGFPWANLATTQTQFLPLIQMLEVSGTQGLGFWLMLVNIGIYLIVHYSRRQRLILWTTVIFGLPWVLGLVRLKTVDNLSVESERKVAIIQPNIDPNQKWETAFRARLYNIMDSLHTEAILTNPDLILWPEASLPIYLRLSHGKRKALELNVQKSGIPLLTGTVDWQRDSSGLKKYFNGAMYIGLNGNQMYHKLRLVPFGEYIPLSGIFPILKELNIGQANFTHGSEYTVFELDSVGFSNMICYESSIPWLSREFVRRGARFLTIEANDAWFGNTSGAYQHFEIAKLRAVELRIAIARSGNTGISGIILPSGRVTAKLNFNEQGIIAGSLPLSNGLSFYGKYGDVFSILCSILSLVIMGLSWIKRRY